MSMVWVVILATFAGFSEHSARLDHDAGRPVIRAAVGASLPGPIRMPQFARRVAHRPCSTPWSSHVLDEFDTEDIDETWVLDLDALSSVPVALMDWARPCSTIEPVSIDDLDSPSATSTPLRC